MFHLHTLKTFSGGIEMKHWTEIDYLQYLIFLPSNFYHFSVKNVRIRSISGPYFPAFGLNTDQKKTWTESLDLIPLMK